MQYAKYDVLQCRQPFKTSKRREVTEKVKQDARSGDTFFGPFDAAPSAHQLPVGHSYVILQYMGCTVCGRNMTVA
ncbi:unnamed protein product [Cylicocyclus nassatus]|uniref:Uncharacterized protein n=1 Tax=Cylicocyclus nassatus TaxID=53992 RepID=A0AA36DNL2_CYLNA|nr:unnamed protein product [Cylicocyclus nassatus]